jgi:hypothetical protein
MLLLLTLALAALPLAAAAEPGKPLIISFSSRSVLLSWTPTASAVSQYLVRVRQGEEGDWADARTVPTGSNRSEFNVTGLRPFTVYSFRVAAVTAAGPEEEGGPSYYMITLREAPSGMPTVTSAYNTSSRSGSRVLRTVSAPRFSSPLSQWCRAYNGLRGEHCTGLTRKLCTSSNIAWSWGNSILSRC